MDSQLRIVTRLPLQELWRDDETFTHVRERWLTANDVTALLKLGPVQFVLADVGMPLSWISLNECYQFWKNEVKPHLAKSDQINLDDYPDGYCYFASMWERPQESGLIVLLEKSH